MKIPLPCEFGESYITAKGIRTLDGVSWFKWFDGMEFTYFFENNKKWLSCDFFTKKLPDYKFCYEVCDTLLADDFLKIKGFPIKGRGFLSGLKTINKKIFAELILTDSYYAHIYAQCDRHGNYIDNGVIFVPPSWDTEQKKYSIILKQYNNVKVDCMSH